MQIRIAPIDFSNQTTEIVYEIIKVLWFLYLPILVKFSVQIALAFGATLWFGMKGSIRRIVSQGNGAKRQDLPKVAVIVPAFNEEVGIVKTIRSILRSNYKNFALLVVNDGSTDGTHEKVTNFIQTYIDPEKRQEVPITYLKLNNGGKANAMNRAIQTLGSDVDIVMTVDADSAVHPDAIAEMVYTFQRRPKVAAVAGNVIVANRSTWIGKIQQVEYLSGFFCKRGDSVFASVYIIGGAAAAYRKSVLDQVGCFDDSVITEDIELSTRILSHNLPTAYAHNAVVYTEGPSDWKSLRNQRLRWKYGRLLTFLKHRNIFFSVQNSNVYLCWFLLPVTLYAEVLLIFEPVLLAFFLLYLAFINMWTFLWVVTLLNGLALLEILVDRQRAFHRNLLPWIPFVWLADMMIELVEWTALIRSVWRLVVRPQKGLTRQKWKRVGIHLGVDGDEDCDTDSDSDQGTKGDWEVPTNPHE